MKLNAKMLEELIESKLTGGATNSAVRSLPNQYSNQLSFVRQLAEFERLDDPNQRRTIAQNLYGSYIEKNSACDMGIGESKRNTAKWEAERAYVGEIFTDVKSEALKSLSEKVNSVKGVRKTLSEQYKLLKKSSGDSLAVQTLQ